MNKIPLKKNTENSYLTHMFWAYGDLSNLEKICINSFAKKGYSLNLWTYDAKFQEVPEGVIVRNAREILPESLVFLNKAKSYASFADLFRYALLNSIGGLYVDTDVVALCEPMEISNKPFLVTERVPPIQRTFKNLIKKSLGLIKESNIQVNNNVIFNPVPIAGNIIDMAYKISLNYPKSEIHWGELGPHLISKLIHDYPSDAFCIKEPDFANSINCWECPKKLILPGNEISKNAKFLHCFNEMWRRSGVNKNQAYPYGSLMYKLSKMYLY